MDTNPENSLLKKLSLLAERATGYFHNAEQEAPTYQKLYSDPSRDCFSELSETTAQTAFLIREDVLNLANPALTLVKNSLISSEADLHDARLALKAIEASVMLQRYLFRDADVAHDEGQVLGFIRETQERTHCDPSRAQRQFNESWRRLRHLLEIAQSATDESRGLDKTLTTSFGRESLRLEQNRAFIIMPMGRAFDDTCDAIKEIFHRYGIAAKRADDIEHEQKITDKILEQIKMSEFLLADLTSEKPNVYYEIGYAHALGRRVIMFCKTGTKRHFDIADYNCPEYESLRDLKEKLSKRLEQLTNKKIS